MFKDERIIKIAKTVTEYSLEVKPKDKVYIKTCYAARPLVKELIKNIYKAGGYPFVKYVDEETERYLNEEATREYLELTLGYEQKMFEELDCFIKINAVENEGEYTTISPEVHEISATLGSDLTNDILQNRRWIMLEWPTKAAAAKANMPFDTCCDYMFEACCADFNEIASIGEKLKNKMLNTDRVKIVSSGTELELSIKDSQVSVTAGKYNLPDGETATAPVIDSINGYITFNTEANYNGCKFKNIRLDFKDGKIVKATADNDMDKLNNILDIDEGARYIGEFAFGLNNKVTKPFGSALYDEKIIGSIHFAAGKSLPGICDNGNKSIIHWDLVQIQTEEYGGGKVYFDGEIVMDNGKLMFL